MLIGFTVMQHAFAGGGLSHSLVSDTERRALALMARATSCSTGTCRATGSSPDRRSRRSSASSAARWKGRRPIWLGLLHPFDVERYSAALDTVIEERRGRIVHDFRLRSAAGPYAWYRLKARP